MFFCTTPLSSLPSVSPVEQHQTVSPYLTALSRYSGTETRNGIETLFNSLFVDFIETKPEVLTELGLFETMGLNGHNRHLNDLSIQADKKDIALAKTYLARLTAYPREHLSFDQELSRQIFCWQLQQMVDGEPFLLHSYPINQMWGVLQQLTVLFMVLQPLDTPRDVENCLVRMKEIGRQFDQLITRVETQRGQEIHPPRFAIAKAVDILDKFLEKPAAESPFYIRFSTQSAETLAYVQQVLEAEVYPAYQKMRDYLAQYLEKLTGNDGVWALPNGDAYYAYILKGHTSLDLTPKQIHTLGTREVARIEKEIASLLKQEEIWDEKLSVGEQLQNLQKRAEFHYPDTDEGREECLRQFEAILERSHKELGPLFSIMPKAALVVRPVPDHEAASAPGAYYLTPSIDGKRSGEFYVNLRNVAEICTFSMETLAIHEGEPGHHFQRSIEMESNLHLLRKTIMNTAYVEGWALYAEKLAYEQGFYSSRFSQIGHLQAELFRAARLVIDTGIHWKRWSREKAISYMSRTTGLPLGEIEGEIERYFVMPGQACAYKTGQLKILALRKAMKERLGDKFSIQDFHAKILLGGVMPLPILERYLAQ